MAGNGDFMNRMARLGLRGQMAAPRLEEAPRGIEWGRSMRPEWQDGLRYFALFGVALVLGMLAVVFARYVTFRTGVGQVTGDPDLKLILDAGVALLALAVIRILPVIRSREHMFCMVLGIWLALCLMHNLVHFYPDAFAQLFSPEWVDQMRSLTRPGSFHFRGLDIVFM